MQSDWLLATFDNARTQLLVVFHYIIINLNVFLFKEDVATEFLSNAFDGFILQYSFTPIGIN